VNKMMRLTRKRDREKQGLGGIYRRMKGLPEDDRLSNLDHTLLEK